MSLRLLIAVVFLQSALVTVPARAENDVALRLSTEPPLTSVRPDGDPVRVAIDLTRADGQPVERARLRVVMTAPSRHPLVSTDFPIVEGTKLVESDVVVEGGRFSFTTVLPIRGTYRIEASLLGDAAAGPSEASPANAASKTVTELWEVSLPENPDKVRNLSLMLAVLAGIGALSGFVLAREAKRAPLFATWLLACLAGLGSPEAEAHGRGDHGTDPAAGETPAPVTAVTPTVPGAPTLELRLETPRPIVGGLTTVVATLREADGRPAAARFQLSLVRLEDGLEVLATEILGPDGTMRWSSQLFDGTTHEARVTALPLVEAPAQAAGSPAPRAALTIDVEAVAPPGPIVAKSLALLLLVMAAGLAVGYAVAPRRARRLAAF